MSTVFLVIIAFLSGAVMAYFGQEEMHQHEIDVLKKRVRHYQKKAGG